MNKTALVTGASGGIGLDIAELLASDGVDLILIARNSDKLREEQVRLSGKYNVSVNIIAADLSQVESAITVHKEVHSRGLTVDYLINNAAFGVYGEFSKTDWSAEAGMLNLNIVTLTHLTKLFLKDMLERGGGKIMNVASTAAFQPGPMMALYYASKAYVLSFSEAIGNELKDKNVTVTALCPGPTKTGFQSAAGIEESRLVKGRKLPDSKEVAAYGVRAMMNGKAVAVPGLLNKFLVFCVRLFPRPVIIRVARFVQDSR
ncbi:MAG: SDR family oxidoreductase [Ignavibacteria bacterium]|nr:SDR family oxidoreductase [Ignavibacteria bacterium]